MESFAERASQSLCRSVGSNHKIAVRSGDVEEVGRTFAQTKVFRICNNTHDLHWRAIAFDETEMLPERTAISEEATGHGAIDNGYVRGLIGWRIRVSVFPGKVSPGEQCNAHCVEIFRRDSHKTFVRDFALADCVAFGGDVDADLLAADRGEV